MSIKTTAAELPPETEAAPEPQAEQTAPPIECKSDELSTNVYWTFGKHEVFSLQTTVRGNPTLEEINEHLASEIDALKLIVDLGGHATGRKQGDTHAAPPPATTPAQAAQEVGKGNAAPPAPATAAPAPAQAGAAPLAMSIVKLAMLPKPDGKCQVSFFEAGHKYPDIYATKAVADWVKFMAPTGGWTHDHFSVVAEYDVAIVVGYVLSDKLNTKGNPYKNLTGVKLA